MGPVRQLGSPMRFSKTPVRRDKAGPLLGEDSLQVLSESGFSPTEISRLVESGVVLAREVARRQE